MSLSTSSAYSCPKLPEHRHYWQTGISLQGRYEKQEVTLHQDSRKAAKAANIATYRPEAIWQPWQSWQPWQPSRSFVRRDTSAAAPLLSIYEKWTEDQIRLSDRFGP